MNPNVKIGNGIFHFFQCTYFFGYTTSILLFWGLSTLIPPPGNRIMQKMDDGFLNGVGPTDLEVASIDQNRLSREHKQNPPEKRAAVTVQSSGADPIAFD